jgi:PAS domain S-box-containing protein
MSQSLNNQEPTIEQLKKELQELKRAYESLKISYDNKKIQDINAINALVESENHFKNIYDDAPVNYQSLDENACFIDVNPTWLSTLGYSREEVIGHHFSEFMTPDSAELIKTRFPFFKASGKIIDFEFEMIRKDGTHLFVNFDGKIGKDEKGNFKQTHCVWTDITKRKQAEESNRIKDWALESSINAIAISDLKGNITYVNPSFYKLWGYTLPQEVIGKQVVEFWQAREKATAVVTALQQSGSWIGELVALTKDGKPFDVQVSASIVNNVSGQPYCMLASFADITESKLAGIIQAENETSYRELFNNVADAIYIQDEKGTFLDVNEGAVKMYGYPREVLIGKNPLFVSAPGKNDLDALAPLLDRAFAGEPQQFEFWGKRSNGEIFPKEVRVVNGTYFGKKVNIAMAHDITERKQAETALQESERRFRELIELAVDGIMIGSPEGIIIGANTYMQNLTGRSIEHLVGINISELFGSNALKNKPLRYDLLKKGETVFGERDIIRPDGKIIPIEMHTKMMPDGTYQSIYRDVTERQRAEEILRESETKFKSLVESTSDMIWETNLEGKYTYISPQFENLLGYLPEEVIGTSPFQYIASENIGDIITQSDEIVKKAVPFSALVNKYKHRNGHILYFETSGVPVFNNSGLHIGFRGISRDITKRHIAEKELHKLSSVVHQNPNTIIITNLEGKMEYINPAGCIISGYSVDELIGKSPSIFSSGETPKETYKSLWTTIKAGKEWKGTFRNKKKNGEYFWESAFILPIRDAEGTVTHYLGVKEDISKRIQAEDALKESEERFRKLFEASPDAIILADIETGMLIDANSAACSMLGYTLNEIRQLHQTMIHPARFEEYSAKSFNEHAEVAITSGTVQPIENFIRRSDGSEIPVEVLSSNITLNGRQILQGVFRNITERKQAREELMKAKEKAEAGDKLKSAFLQNISHELRTPLNGIIGFSEMITQMDSTEEDRVEFNKMIKRSSTRLINTITSYMDISMIVSGITEINLRSFSLRNFLNNIIDQTTDSCNSRNLLIDIINNAPVEDIQIKTDENLLGKIFFHLIDNAIKFTKRGSVTIGYNLKAGYHQFSISDTGTGISNDSLSVIFEIFRQADLTTSRSYEGSGLGLSIARGFVKLLGGDIHVESVPNEGSTFFFTIPAEIPGTNEIDDTQKSSQPVQPIILVAEDDDSNYKYLEIVLKKASFKILRARNGFETVDICRNHPEICILLTDMKMPGMDGLESTRAIREILPDLPIIALSGLISSGDEDAARNAGCNEYIVKPVSKSKLLETIYNLLSPGKY